MVWRRRDDVRPGPVIREVLSPDDAALYRVALLGIVGWPDVILGADGRIKSGIAPDTSVYRHVGTADSQLTRIPFLGQ
jgi:hypothetical protein